MTRPRWRSAATPVLTLFVLLATLGLTATGLAGGAAAAPTDHGAAAAPTGHRAAAAPGNRGAGTETFCIRAGYFVPCAPGGVQRHRASPSPSPRPVPSHAVFRPPTRTPGSAGDAAGTTLRAALVGTVVVATLAGVALLRRRRHLYGSATAEPAPSWRARSAARPSGAFRRRPLLRLGSVLAAAALLYNSFVWLHIHTKPDNGYRRFVAWQAAHIPRGTTMSVTEGSAQFLLTGLVLGNWDTQSELRAHQVQWVLVSVRLIDQGYDASPNFLHLLEQHARLLFDSATPIGLRLYDVRSMTGAP